MDEQIADTTGETSSGHSPDPLGGQTAQSPPILSAVNVASPTTRSDADAVRHAALAGHPGFAEPQLGYYYPPQPGYPQGVFVPVQLQSTPPQQLASPPLISSIDVPSALPQTVPTSAFEPSTSFIVTPLPPSHHPMSPSPLFVGESPTPPASTAVMPGVVSPSDNPSKTTSSPETGTIPATYDEPDRGRPCRRCGQIINPGFPRCPYCNRSQIRWYQHPMLWVLVILILAIALLYHFSTPARLATDQGIGIVESFLSSLGNS
jgi:hypothetical protein